MDGMSPLPEGREMNYRGLGKPARREALLYHFSSLLWVNDGLITRGSDFVQDMFQKYPGAVRILLDIREPHMSEFSGIWPGTAMPIFGIDHRNKQIIAPVHTTLLALAFDLIRDIRKGGTTPRNLQRYDAFKRIRDILTRPVEEGLTELRFSPMHEGNQVSDCIEMLSTDSHTQEGSYTSEEK